MGGVTRKSRRADRARRTKVRGRLRTAEEKQRHVELRLRDAEPVSGFVVGLDDKHVELTRLGEPGVADGTETVRLRDVVKVRRTPAPVAPAPRGRFAYLEEVEELAQAVVDEAFEEGWPYDALGVDRLTELQKAIRELACVVRRPEEPVPDSD